MTPDNKENLLSFFKGNAKLGKDIYTFSLPSGYTCPGACDCLAKADIQTGKITDGPNQKYRCFSATNESRPAVRKSRWKNFYLLTACKTSGEMADLIERSLPEKAEKIRIHVGGDFYSQTYFDAWLEVIQAHPNIVFYAYTKSAPFVEQRINTVTMLENFRVVSSSGGKYDHVAEQLGLIQAHVVLHPEEAEALNLEIDHDDTHAIENENSFALLLHGTQPKDSVSGEALKRLKREKVKFSYSTKNDTDKKAVAL